MESKESIELLKNSADRKEGMYSAWLQRRLETPSTPGRPVFSFSTGNLYRKSFPSKWDNAEKWLMSSSCHESPAHGIKPWESSNSSKPNEAPRQKAQAFETFAKKQNLTQTHTALHRVSTEALLKDKFTDSAEPVLSNFICPETSKDDFFWKDSHFESAKKTESSVSKLHSRDVGTEITPLCSLNTSSCHTPIKSSSPARHNTPADRSGPLVASSTKLNISELNNFNFAKLEFSAQYDSTVCSWNSREEEEEEVSKSLRHCEMNDGRKCIADSRASLWEAEERAKSCIRYQREEAKIQAWVNLQTAKTEEKSKKLEVKIQNMRSNLEEKLMKRMAVVHRRSEEWRAEAQLQHSQQLLKAAEQAQKMRRSQQSFYFGDHNASCGCFPMQQ
ncbi:hypothetical protein IEQ34_019286 [Dendrobium chrysotoxum]|uniref:Remorin C-terminal domain-containing protein n=1 Tax=Dendrobium chrysotoxum TaxID=161865 RepID=A0AAV7G8D5_DENCH|nr:hypothetical protein IEQ34_019286 [Dendrobium chrysotoxum]